MFGLSFQHLVYASSDGYGRHTFFFLEKKYDFMHLPFKMHKNYIFFPENLKKCLGLKPVNLGRVGLP